MKKIKIALFSLVISVLLCGCTYSTVEPKTGLQTEAPPESQNVLGSNDNYTEETPDESAATITTVPEPTPYTSTPTLSPTSTPYISTPKPTPTPTLAPSTEPTPEPATYTYSVWAESGAVITSQDSSTGEFHYKQKCEACGDVKGGATLSFVSSGNGLNTSFTCSKCGNHQKVVIGWSCIRS
ncbi:MAG: hypothetical protein QMB62_09680 [Oscillospiraceae bacterium]